MASAEFETQRGELETALKAARPHFSWAVHFDQGESEQAHMMFIAGRNDAGKTWQHSLPSQRLETDDIETLTDEILEVMDDELSG